MCLVAFHWDPGADAPLTVAANRDEFYARPAAPLAWWPGGRLLAGRDLRAGGTWMGLSRDGRFAALTNHRDPALTRPDGPSRGGLPVRFLEGRASAAAFVAELQAEAPRFSPFNLLLFDGVELIGFESRRGRRVSFAPGFHAVSNGDFDEPWPKVRALLAGLDADLPDDEALFRRLADRTVHPDEALPRTGVDLAWERALSPAFVQVDGYGTRASTVVRIRRADAAVVERRFGPAGPEGTAAEAFRRDPA